jgi:predicted RNA-binding Zn-ribbon protein involved in translation (DUF1610 family)
MADVAKADPPEAVCPECGHGPVHINVTTKAAGTGHLYTEEYAGKTIWLIPLAILQDSGYESAVTLDCESCGWEIELDEDDWEAGR